MKTKTYEILLHATLVTRGPVAQLYEFVLNQDLNIIECMQVHSLVNNRVTPVRAYHILLKDTLFELNHVRINPYIDNTYIITKLSQTLKNIGVDIKNTPHLNDVAQCYKPLGEITENVRFYFNERGLCTFLCPNVKLTLVQSDTSSDGPVHLNNHHPSNYPL